MANDVMIAAYDLSKQFGSFRALDKVNFEVRRGEIVGFLGPNGAGKSTTMRILTCFISATSGRAQVNGHDVFDNPLEVRASIGYLPQRAPLYLDMGVLEYLKFAADLRNLEASRFKARAESVVEVCGLGRALGKTIGTLSHGYRQRVGLAQALIHDPEILILDEPTADLDPNEKAEFIDYLKTIGKNRTVLLSTHVLSEVEHSCQRAIIVAQGRIVADGPLAEIRSRSGRIRYVVTVAEAAGSGSGDAVSESRVKESLGALSEAEGIAKLANSEDKALSFELTSPGNVDLRADIFRLMVDKGWTMLELRRDTQTLEDVFRQLTIGDERRNRKIGPASNNDVDDDDEDDDDED